MQYFFITGIRSSTQTAIKLKIKVATLQIGMAKNELKLVAVKPIFENKILNKSWTKYIPNEYLDKVKIHDFVRSEKLTFKGRSFTNKNTAID